MLDSEFCSIGGATMPARVQMATERRKKTGMEILPSLMTKMKERALDQQVPLWRVVQDALEAYLGVEAEPSDIPRHLWRYPEKFRRVLASGHAVAIDSATRNVDALLEFVELAGSGKPARKGR